jgi:GTP-binding protein
MEAQITSAEFVKGVTGDNYMQTDGRAQIAFLGRSNVGKSSVLNTLLNRSNLVHSSKKPGKTQQANFYLINDEFYFIDFPGYGYAKMSKKDRDKMIKRILWYIQFSPARPKLVVVVLDVQVGLTAQDKEMLQILKAHGHRVVIVANKIDKVKQMEAIKKIKEIKSHEIGLDIVEYSAKTKHGRHQLLEKVFEVL